MTAVRTSRQLCGIGVGIGLALKISQHGLFVIKMEDIIGIHRCFAAAARRVNDKIGNGIAGNIAPYVFHDFNSFGDRRSKMADTLREIALIQIIGPHPDFYQTGKELL